MLADTEKDYKCININIFEKENLQFVVECRIEFKCHSHPVHWELWMVIKFIAESTIKAEAFKTVIRFLNKISNNQRSIFFFFFFLNSDPFLSQCVGFILVSGN